MSEAPAMCGRFSLSVPVKDLASLFGFDLDELMDPQPNIAPTQTVAVVRAAPETGRPELVRLRWGLIPSWAKDASIGNKHFNARAETVTEKPSFRNAFKRRRCLNPARGCYEWKRETISIFRECTDLVFYGANWDSIVTSAFEWYPGNVRNMASSLPEKKPPRLLRAFSLGDLLAP